MDIETKVYDFENINLIKKNSVIGLLRKLAKQSDSESESDSNED
jgi:hypothetical protein